MPLPEAKVSRDADFCDWLFWLTEGGRRFLGLLGGYFDESEKGDQFFVGGCLFSKSQATKFQRQWGVLFAPYGGCHMNEFVFRRGPFEGMGDGVHNRLMRRAVAILNHRVELMVLMDCRISDAGEVFGATTLDQAKQAAYFACGAHGAIGMAGYSLHHRNGQRIVYTYESGRKGFGEIERFFNKIKAHADLTQEFCYGATQTSPKETSGLNQQTLLLGNGKSSRRTRWTSSEPMKLPGLHEDLGEVYSREFRPEAWSSVVRMTSLCLTDFASG